MRTVRQTKLQRSIQMATMKRFHANIAATVREILRPTSNRRLDSTKLFFLLWRDKGASKGLNCASVCALSTSPDVQLDNYSMKLRRVFHFCSERPFVLSQWRCICLGARSMPGVRLARFREALASDAFRDLAIQFVCLAAAQLGRCSLSLHQAGFSRKLHALMQIEIVRWGRRDLGLLPQLRHQGDGVLDRLRSFSISDLHAKCLSCGGQINHYFIA
jgi:hypothetical protein